jgi:Tol biopolymer transport system component/imidazolonepropionase-like amidohydrolase
MLRHASPLAKKPRGRGWRGAGLLIASFCWANATGGDALPLQPERQLTFETSSGTWMSLDIAPDGQTLVFDLLGDIYALDAAGGEARPLLTGTAFESQPVFSPDGKQIAFVSDRDGNENLWVARSDGSAARALSALDDNTEFSSPAWAPDGRSVFVSTIRPDLGVFELWRYETDGGARTRVAPPGAADEQPPPGKNALGAAASPDGRYLYYAVRGKTFETARPFAPWSIARHDLQTGDEAVIVTGHGGAVRPAVSPDGRTLVYATRRDGESALRARDLVSGADRELAFPVQIDQQEAWATLDLMPRHVFTPDGRAVLFSHAGRIRRVELASGAVKELPFTARVDLQLGHSLRREIAEDEGPVRARLIQGPEQSPDGRRIVFSAVGRLYVMDLAGGAPRRLTDGDAPEFQPSWSPDGRAIVYVTWTARDAGHIWRVPAEGGVPKRLTGEPAYYSDPVFTPDGRGVMTLRSSHHERMHRAMEYGAFRQADVVRLPSEGGHPAVVASGSLAGPVQFTRERGRFFIYTSEGMSSFRLDGSDRRVHFRVTGPAYYFEAERAPVKELRISPDGRHALAQIRSQLYLVKVPGDGEAPVTIDLGRPPQGHHPLTTVGADFIAWADEGRTITWALGSTFYRRPLASVRFGETETNASIAARSESFSAVVELPRDRAEGVLLLRGATVVTMRGDEVVEDADLLIVDNRIAAIGRRGEVDVPTGATVRDLSGRFIVPGFIDTHVHWAEIRRGALDLESYTFLANLAFGVTAGLDVSTLTIDMLAYQDMIDAGLMLGPRGFSTGPAVFAFNDFQSGQHALDVLTRYREHYRVQNLKQYRAGNRRQRQWVAVAADALGLMPTTEGAANLKLSLTQVLDGFAGVEHALPVAGLGEDVIELFARSGTSISPTLTLSDWGPAIGAYIRAGRPENDPKVRRFFPPFIIDMKTQWVPSLREDQQLVPHHARDIARLVRAGGLVGAGSHSEFQGIGLHWEMQMLARGGLSPHEILHLATLGSAEVIGRSASLGSIDPGKLADLVVLERDPMEDIANTLSISSVMKNGRLYDGASLDELWPRQRPLTPLWFHAE